MKARGIILILVIALIAAGLGTSKGQTPEQLYQKGLVKEEGEGNLQDAIGLYNQVADNSAAGKSLQAKALLHIGMCYEKLGREEAVKAYQRLVNTFPNEKNEVAIARERLYRLVQIAGEASAIQSMPVFTRIQMPCELARGAQLSPDGKKLTFSSTMYEGSIWTVPIPGNVSPEIAGKPEKLIGDDKVWGWGHSWSADGKWIAYNYMRNDKAKKIFVDEVHVISSSGGEPVKIAVPVNRGGSFHLSQYVLSLSPDGQILAYASKEEGESDNPKESYIYTIPVKGGIAKRLTGGGTWLPEFSPDGKKIAYIKTSDKGNELWVIPAFGGDPAKVCNLEGSALGPPKWSPGSDYLAYLLVPKNNELCKNIWIVPLTENGEASSAPKSIEIPLQASVNLGGWTTDNKIGLLLLSPVHQAIYTVPSSGGKTTQITPAEGFAFCPVWNPDGKSIYIVYKGEFSSVASEGGKISAIPVTWTGEVNYPCISPDGEKVLFHGLKKGVTGMHIWTVSTKGGEPTQVIRSPFADNFIEDAFPQWSPDGKTISFYRHEKSPDGNGVLSSLCLVPAEGGDVRVLVSDPDKTMKEISPRSMCWTPDGKSIAYYCNDDGKIKTIPVGNSEPRILAVLQKGIQAQWITFSPNGKEILYTSNGKIWTISLNADEPVEIKTGSDIQPAGPLTWSPDGNRIAFTIRKGGDINLWMMENFLPLEKSAQTREKISTEPEGIRIRQIWKSNLLEDLGTVSSDGKFRSYVDWGVGNVALHNLLTDEKKKLTDKASLGDTNYFALNTAISRNGRLIASSWCKPYNTTDLVLIDTENPTMNVLYSKKGEEVYPVAWLSDNEFVATRFFPEERSVQIVSFNFPNKTLAVLKSFEKIQNLQLACSPDEKYIAYDFKNESDNGNSDVNILSANGDEDNPLIRHPANDKVFGWIPGRNEFLFLSDRSGTWDLWAIQLVDGKPAGPPKRIYADIGDVSPMGFTQDGKYYFGFVRRNFSTSLTPFDSQKGVIETGSGESLKGSNFGMTWSPDGQYLAYMNLDYEKTGHRPLLVRNLKTGKEHDPSNNLLTPWEFEWSPDGNSILVVGWENNKERSESYKGGVFKVDVRTGQTDKIFLLTDYQYNIPADDAYPLSGIEWAPDGKSFYYLFFKDRLAKHDLETGEDKILYKNNDFTRHVLDLSPDGKTLLFGIKYPGEEKSRLVTIPAEGGEIKEICTAQESKNVNSAFWSPDGMYIYFVEVLQSMKTNLWRVLAMGGKPVKTWSSENRVELFDIHPDGNQVAYSIRERATEVRVMENLVQEIEKIYGKDD